MQTCSNTMIHDVISITCVVFWYRLVAWMVDYLVGQPIEQFQEQAFFCELFAVGWGMTIQVVGCLRCRYPGRDQRLPTLLVMPP